MNESDPSQLAEQDVRAPGIAVAGLVLVVATLLIAMVAVFVAIGQLGDDPPEPVEATVLIDDAAFPVALTPTGDGGFLYAEKESGAVRAVDADGTLDPAPVAAFDVNPDRQRGLVGLAEIDGELFGSYVRSSDDRLVVVRAADDAEVWVGPVSTDLANGGHLVPLEDGTLLIGIGDLQDRPARDRDDTENGKLLIIDPAERPDQEPEVLSAGWNNPFAIVLTEDGTVWVADNAPGSEPERIGRGDRPATEASDLAGMRAPSALVELPDGRLGVCGFISGSLDAVDVSGDPHAAESLLTPCRIGAAVLGDGRVITATETQIFSTTLPTG